VREEEEEEHAGSMAFFKDLYATNGAFKFYVNGEWKESDSGKTVDIINPFTLQKEFKIQGHTSCHGFSDLKVVHSCHHMSRLDVPMGWLCMQLALRRK
jgi:hypothetical protein